MWKYGVLFLKKTNLSLIEHKLCMNNQVNDTGSDEALVNLNDVFC